MTQNAMYCDYVYFPLMPTATMPVRDICRVEKGLKSNPVLVESNLPQIARVVSAFTDIFSNKAIPVSPETLSSCSDLLWHS